MADVGFGEALKRYREALEKTKERDTALEEFQAAGEIPETDPYEDAMSEAKEAQKNLKLMSEEAKVNKDARKLNDNEFSEFKLSDESNNKNYDDVLEQIGLMPEKNMSEEIMSQKATEATPEVVPSLPSITPEPKSNEIDFAGALGVQPVGTHTMEMPEGKPSPIDVLKRFNAAKNGEKPETKVDPLQEALRQKQYNDALAMMVSGAAKAGAGMAGGSLSQIKADTSMADQMRKSGKETFDLTSKMIEDAATKEANKGKKSYEDALLKKQTEYMDVKSPISEQMRSILKEKFGKELPDVDFTSMSAYDADKFMQRMGQFSNSSSNPEMDALKKSLTEARIGTETAKGKYYEAGAETRKDTLDERIEKDRTKYQARKNKLLKEVGYREAKSGFQDVEFLLEDAREKGGQSLAALGTRLAKALGEKGTLTDADVIRYLEMPSLVGATQDEIVKQLSNKLSGQSYENIKRMVDGIKGVMDKKRAKVEDEVAKEYMSSRSGGESGLTKEQAYEMLGFESQPESKAQDPKIEDYAKQYNMSYDKAEQLLRSRGYGKK